jgi:hypothetical protein
LFSSIHRFDVEAVWIDGAVRAFEPKRQSPAFPGGNGRHGIDFVAVFPLRVPRQRQSRRHDRAVRFDPLHRECEARATRRGLRGLVDDADDGDIDALPFGWKLISETRLSAPRGVAEAEGTRGCCDQQCVEKRNKANLARVDHL